MADKNKKTESGPVESNLTRMVKKQQKAIKTARAFEKKSAKAKTNTAAAKK